MRLTIKKCLSNFSIQLLTLTCVGILFSGCAGTQPNIDTTKNVSHSAPTSVDVFGEKIPLSYFERIPDYSSAIKTYRFDGNNINGKMGSQQKFYFDQDKLPTYRVRFQEPSIILAVKIHDDMQLKDFFYHKTHVEDFDLFNGNSVLRERQSYVVNEFQDSKEALFVSSPLVRELKIKVNAVSLSSPSLLPIVEVTPHMVEVVAIGQRAIYDTIEKVLKERHDPEANERLLQAVQNNDSGFYSKLMRNKDRLALPENKNKTQKPIDVKTADTKNSQIKAPQEASQKEQNFVQPIKEQPVAKKQVFSGISIEKIQIGEDNTSQTTKKTSDSKKKEFIDFSKSVDSE